MRTDVTDRGGGAAPPAREGLVVLFVASIGTHGLEGNVVLFVASIGTHGAFAYRGESVRRGGILPVPLVAHREGGSGAQRLP
jgi:hypothetical protein